ncbi:low specificity L-threonine aldolase [Frankia sp. CiP3]|uniref:threonine aldolase family protein n=1 Tax=Frankia sp. CiP3 TaxID=2880971 RepID=UPI0035B2008A
MIDLRSDTVTRPAPGMRAAMARAEVGDDCYGEDPTVAALEERVADLFGHEAAVFVPSGTMGNQICLRLLVPPAEELLCDADAHIVTYEGGGAAQHGGISTRTIVSPRGVLQPDAVAQQLRPEGFRTVVTRAVAVEQTANRAGGAVYPMDVLESLRAVTRSAGVALHCDGARIWNAIVATGLPAAAFGRLFDTMSVCLSKGMGAPVGSLVVCSASRAAVARVLRRRLGGGMRQAGIVAAAGIYALDHHVERLADDHKRARRLARRIADVAPSAVDVDTVQTNMIVLDLSGTGWPAGEFTAAAARHGLLLQLTGPQRVRAVTHLDIDDEDIDSAATLLHGLLGR